MFAQAETASQRPELLVSLLGRLFYGVRSALLEGDPLASFNLLSSGDIAPHRWLTDFRMFAHLRASRADATSTIGRRGL